MNLVINARDAISGRGTITAATEDVVGMCCSPPASSTCRREYVLSVTDTGCGMPGGARTRSSRSSPQGAGRHRLGVGHVYGITAVWRRHR
jgi:signal transduction histidine kinase